MQFTMDILAKSELLEPKMLQVCRQSSGIDLKPPARDNKSQELSSTSPWHTSRYKDDTEHSLRTLAEGSG